ncbi:MAG: phosphate/phosphite/phosphonate ABC transporter substrate-binding protein [Acidobacteria bacterium]|nr:phosphate/phosphite/phosphonate ABC transporter substrate-binding protein [Acidobacteriota bacterium]
MVRSGRSFAILAALALFAAGPLAAGSPVTGLVVCAPGYPGSTAEAQPVMDALAAALATAAHRPAGSVRASYEASEAGGVAAMGSPRTALALVTLPFFLKQRKELGLKPVAQAVPAGRAALEPWTLVVGRGTVNDPADLAGWELRSLAGFSPRFVRRVALGGWGRLPETVHIRFTGAVLSGLRRAAAGRHVAVLLDGEQAAALDGLPFRSSLAILHRSPPLPVSLLCTVHGRGSGLAKAALKLSGTAAGSSALAGLHLDRFEPVDTSAVAAAARAFGGTAPAS